GLHDQPDDRIPLLRRRSLSVHPQHRVRLQDAVHRPCRRERDPVLRDGALAPRRWRRTGTRRPARGQGDRGGVAVSLDRGDVLGTDAAVYWQRVLTGPMEPSIVDAPSSNLLEVPAPLEAVFRPEDA